MATEQHEEIRCPECGKPLGPGGESPRAHLNDHWTGIPRREMSKEARARKDKLVELEKDFPPDDLGEEE